MVYILSISFLGELKVLVLAEVFILL